MTGEPRTLQQPPRFPSFAEWHRVNYSGQNFAEWARQNYTVWQWGRPGMAGIPPEIGVLELFAERFGEYLEFSHRMRSMK